jgi:hypothetical protein
MQLESDAGRSPAMLLREFSEDFRIAFISYSALLGSSLFC